MTRQRLALRRPAVDVDYRDFPGKILRRDVALYRAHRRDRRMWWFSSDLSGRFDVPEPEGTCYFATDAVTAIREKVGPEVAASGTVPIALLAGVVVSRLRGFPAALVPLRVADTVALAALKFGVTREIDTVTPYEIPQAWAATFRRVGFGGVRYGCRFTGGEPNGVAVFGASGDPGWPAPTASQDASHIAAEAELTVSGPPQSNALPMRSPESPRRT